MGKITGNKTQKIPIGYTEDCYLLVNFDWEVIRHPKRTEECHGLHDFNEDELIYKVQSVSIYLNDSFYLELDVKKLESKQESAIESLLSIED